MVKKINKIATFSSSEETEKILEKIDRGRKSGFIRQAIKEKAERDGI